MLFVIFKRQNHRTLFRLHHELIFFNHCPSLLYDGNPALHSRSISSYLHFSVPEGLPCWLSWQRICLQCGRPGLGRYSGGGKGYPLQDSYPENSMTIHASIFHGSIHGLSMGHRESGTTECLSLHFPVPAFLSGHKTSRRQLYISLERKKVNS